jgi:glycosyltransferase involved in cell wall biosynthesis
MTALEEVAPSRLATIPHTRPLRVPAAATKTRILAFATQGAGGDDEMRLRDLLGKLPAEIFSFQRRNKKESAFQLLKKARSHRYSLLVMEGTGSAGGLAVILAKWLFGIPYIVSSGDAVAPFLAARWPLAKWVFVLFEWLLYRNSSGFIGWTPYLVGRALTMGAPKGMTAAGWAPYLYSQSHLAGSRSRLRRSLGIPEDAIVFGIAGSLIWSKRWQYCYGHELVQAVLAARNPAIRVLIVGDGEGLDHLRELAGSQLGKTIFLPGRVPRDQVPEYLAAMDAVTLPQSVDNVGSFRYTTKLSEYLSVRVPLITNQIPASYDLDYGGVWQLPGTSPWDPCFVQALTNLMDRVSPEAIEKKHAAIPSGLAVFDRLRQIRTTGDFINEILAAPGRH